MVVGQIENRFSNLIFKDANDNNIVDKDDRLVVDRNQNGVEDSGDEVLILGRERSRINALLCLEGLPLNTTRTKSLTLYLEKLKKAERHVRSGGPAIEDSTQELFLEDVVTDARTQASIGGIKINRRVFNLLIRNWYLHHVETMLRKASDCASKGWIGHVLSFTTEAKTYALYAAHLWRQEIREDMGSLSTGSDAGGPKVSLDGAANGQLDRLKKRHLAEVRRYREVVKQRADRMVREAYANASWVKLGEAERWWAERNSKKAWQALIDAEKYACRGEIDTSPGGAFAKRAVEIRAKLQKEVLKENK